MKNIFFNVTCTTLSKSENKRGTVQDLQRNKSAYVERPECLEDGSICTPGYHIKKKIPQSEVPILL